MNGSTRHGAAAFAWLLAITALAGAFLPEPVLAQAVNTTGLAEESRAEKDVDIEADQMQIKETEKLAIFTGNVDARRGTVKLQSDKLIVRYADAKKQDGDTKTEVTHLDAEGNVVIITGNQRITGNWAKMDVKANHVHVGGDVQVTQGQTVVKGKKLFVDLDKNISQFSGGRVKGSFLPEN